MREVASDILIEAGYTVVATDSAAGALQALDEMTFSIMLTDVVMPAMNGFELSRIVNKRYPDLAIVMCSGHLAEDLDSEGLEPRLIENRLKKPYTRDEILKVVRTELDT
jgi:DNA-binding NtrC family response regulator